MALIACGECGKQISDKAASCPHCGAPSAAKTEPLPLEEPRAARKRRLWLWIPLGLLAAFLVYAALLPEYKIHAREMREACEVMIGADISRQRECDKIYNDAIARGRAQAGR